MAAEWVRQSKVCSATAGTRERTAWLRPFRGTFVVAIRSYFQREPDGEQVTLECFCAISRSVLVAAGAAVGRAEQDVKKDVGLYVPILLTELVGPENVLTYRSHETRKNSTRPRSSRWSSIDWVANYTPHKLEVHALPLLDSGRGTGVLET